jgi:CHAT domain-containing protein
VKRITAFAASLCVAGLLAASVPAQQSAPPSKPISGTAGAEHAASPAEAITKAREALRKADAEHPGNTPEVAAALIDLVTLLRDQGIVDTETVSLVDRQIQIAEAIAGRRSKDYVAALDAKADILTGLDRISDARPIADEAFEITQKEFPNSAEATVADDEMGRICSKMGDYGCAVRAQTAAVAVSRKLGGDTSEELMTAVNNLGALKSRMGDVDGAIKAQEEALAIGYRLHPDDNHIGVIENNLGSNELKVQRFDEATKHLNRAVEMLSKLYGPDNPRVMQVNRNLGRLYTRTGQFPRAWKCFEFSFTNKFEQIDQRATGHALFAESLAEGGDAARAVQEGLSSARLSRELFVLQARTLPERQALAYDATRPHGLDTSLSVVLKHPELPNAEIYQEAVRSRALVADEMAHRQKNLNANNDPVTARLLKELDQARADLLAAERSPAHKAGEADPVEASGAKMEAIERSLAEHSALLRADERIYQVTTDDIRHNLPARSVLISYLQYRRVAVDATDPAAQETLSFAAFVVHPGSDRISILNLGDAASLDGLVLKARAAADAEAHSGGLGSVRNERAYRDAALGIRQRVWDPLKKEIGDAKLVLVVADGSLNLVPFAGLPDGNGYLVEHAPVIHVLSSERDLVPAAEVQRKTGLLAIGSPSFGLAGTKVPAPPVRGAGPACEEFSKIEFQPLPGTAEEVSDIDSTWRKWNPTEPSQLVTGDNATLAAFLANAAHSRVLHVATHAFLLDKSCGSGNPLLHSGLVFAGGGHGSADSILTAQQIASLDLDGVDWAVLSACNTGNGELRDGEGVLGLQRAFRVAGARSVIMTLWPVDDEVARRFMHRLYAERLGGHATTANAVWSSSRRLLVERRAAGKSTHPWYWAGFVGSGGWE